MKTKLAIIGAVIIGFLALVVRFMGTGNSSGLQAATESIEKSKAKITEIKKKGVEERKKIRGTSEKDSVNTLNDLDRD